MKAVHPSSYAGQKGIVRTNAAAVIYRSLPATRSPTDTDWLETKDGDPAFVHLYRTHYSSRSHKGANLVLGPGRKLALILPDGEAAAGFRYCWFREQKVIYFAFFLNRSHRLSSDLIRSACQLAQARWPAADVVTMVDGGAVLSRNPGYCFKCAGFVSDGMTQGGLVSLRLRGA